MDEQKPILKIKNLNKHFHIAGNRKFTFRELFSAWLQQGKTSLFHALKDVNMELYPGDFIGVIGHNGSGKSTLLKIIAGIYEPDPGSVVKLHGHLVPFLELGVGFNPEFTGRENIYLNGTILGMKLAYLDKKFAEIVRFAELEEFINNPVKNYSSGMMVRLAFSIAIQAHADIFILDEVLGVGDETFRRKSARFVQQLAKEGKTIIFVSHELEEIETLCTKVAWFDHGELKFFGNTHEGLRLYRESVTARENAAIPETVGEFTQVGI
jgi:ABC-2 type transport system ATP-binding protein